MPRSSCKRKAEWKEKRTEEKVLKTTHLITAEWDDYLNNAFELLCDRTIDDGSTDLTLLTQTVDKHFRDVLGQYSEVS
jgi:hypothetical protein